MKKSILMLVAALALGASASTMEIWSNQPALDWNDRYPIGNGLVGAMVAGAGETRIQFNHGRLWTGKPNDYARSDAVKVLPELRRLALAGKKKEAAALADKCFMSVPLRQEAFLPCGEVVVRFPGKTADLRRSLNIETGLHTATFSLPETGVAQETFTPYDEPEFLFHRIQASKPGQLNCSVAIEVLHKDALVTPDANGLVLTGRVQADGVSFCANLRATVRGGTMRAEGGRLVVAGADALELRLAVATDMKSWKEISGNPVADCTAAHQRLAGKSYEVVRAAHVKKFSGIVNRARLDLGEDPALAKLSTPERLERQAQTHDPAFVTLMFDFGRYLLISSSRPGGEPSNLQGIWNCLMHPPWGSKYTCNIDTQMNYWPAEVTGLGDLVEPLERAIHELAESGARTAAKLYGAKGWVLHHNFDGWRGTAPIDGAAWGVWQTGGAWLCYHLWEHWLYTRDRAFLARSWGPMRSSAEFFTDSLIRHPVTGRLVTCPSCSPEHGGLVAGPAMDMQIIRALYEALLVAAKELGKEDDPVVAKVREQLPNLEPNHIGRWGQLQEWVEDVDNPKDKHRHFSHLWAVHPGAEITFDTPKLLAAAKTSLIARGDEATGWSMGWKVNMWARFHDGDRAERIMHNLFIPKSRVKEWDRGYLFQSLLDSCGHRSAKTFQIDGNFGLTAGVAELLLQSHRVTEKGETLIEVLPALPSRWQNGSVKGFRARGGHIVDFTWRNGKVVDVSVHGGSTPYKLQYAK